MLIQRRLCQSICQHPRKFENRGFYNCSSIGRILHTGPVHFLLYDVWLAGIFQVFGRVV